jgi:hypothetical protein
VRGWDRRLTASPAQAFSRPYQTAGCPGASREVSDPCSAHWMHIPGHMEATKLPRADPDGPSPEGMARAVMAMLTLAGTADLSGRFPRAGRSPVESSAPLRAIALWHFVRCHLREPGRASCASWPDDRPSGGALGIVPFAALILPTGRGTFPAPPARMPFAQLAAPPFSRRTGAQCTFKGEGHRSGAICRGSRAFLLASRAFMARCCLGLSLFQVFGRHGYVRRSGAPAGSRHLGRPSTAGFRFRALPLLSLAS